MAKEHSLQFQRFLLKYIEMCNFRAGMFRKYFGLGTTLEHPDHETELNLVFNHVSLKKSCLSKLLLTVMSESNLMPFSIFSFLPF